MVEIGRLLEMVARGVPSLILRPWDFPFFWLLVGLVALQYRRVAENERRLYGVAKNQALRHVLVAMGYGLIGGVVASLLMAFLGVSLSGTGVVWLLPLALLLMAVSPRLMCFSYAGGLVSASYLLFGWPKVHVPALMALVAVLHVTESVLIFLRGSSCATPVTVRDAVGGGVRSGFLLQGFWPLPLLMLFVVILPPGAAREGLMEMPSWWPLVAPPAELAAQPGAVFTLFPVAAVLGYSDLAARFSPRTKARRSAALLLGYSFILLALAVISSTRPEFVWLAALWGPLGHELVVKQGTAGEFRERGALAPAPDGVTVLDVLPGGGAQAAGVQSGDVLLEVDGQPTVDPSSVASAMGWGNRKVTLAIRRDGIRRDLIVELRAMEPDGPPVLGIIPLPPDGVAPQLEVHNRGFLQLYLRRLLRR
ncbi:MAG: PDZ domain-containing protein [Bacillota bacterium]|nr:PDZ domain-containing protein [Bacillota bacterium]